MVNQEILEGLRHAISRKETLQKAMMTFFNAGYKKDEIEEAARIIHKERLERDIISQEPMPIAETKNKLTQEQIQEENIIKEAEPKKENPKSLPTSQKTISKQVSNYPEKPKKVMNKGLKIALIIIIILAILLGLFYLLSHVLKLF